MAPTFQYSAALVSAFFAVLSHASPVPWDKPPQICPQGDATISGGTPIAYSITSTLKNQQGDPVTGDYSCPGTGGTCTFSDGNQFSVGVDIEVGLDLSLDLAKITGDAGISGSVTTTTQTSTTQSVQKACPDGPWTCALIIWPPVTKVTGTQYGLDEQCKQIPSTVEPYSIVFPEKTSNGLQVGAKVDICACKNFEHWADAGAPSIVCPQDCVA